MTPADLDAIDAHLIKGSTMTSEHVDRVRVLIAQLRALLTTPRG